ncbi:MAG: putative 2-amino-4-deoxychorismate dehydrogenase [Promethearchaeota archaeon]|nr:MAG: putative 2-amino-4-deoxychorismate dehydrogenase [Candidatus Lokiarchaeota archaeon]
MEKIIRLICLNGSPNKNGNTATAMAWVAAGAEELGAKVEWLHIADLDINYCKGCNSCLKTGKCVLSDDLQIVLEKIRDADGVISGSPVYGGRPTAQLKTLLDRLTLLKLYAGILGDGFSVGVATSGIAPTKRVAKDSANMFGKRIGVMGIKTASLNGEFTSLQINSDHKKKKNAKKLGRKLVKKCRQGGKTWSLKSAWIGFLRKYFLKRLLKKNRVKFAGVIEIWKEKGWY